jgi:hypothetical protein
MATESRMNAQQAALELDSILRSNAWYLCVGVGAAKRRPTLFVYVKSARGSALPRIQKDWKGFNIVIRRARGLRAAV